MAAFIILFVKYSTSSLVVNLPRPILIAGRAFSFNTAFKIYDGSANPVKHAEPALSAIPYYSKYFRILFIFAFFIDILMLPGYL